MEKSETFKIQFKGKIFEIPKSSVKFQNGYAVVQKTIKDSASTGFGGWYDYDLTLRGVIDEEFDTVFDFKGWYPQIQIFPEGNIVVTVRFSGGDGEQAYTRYENHHYKVNGKKSSKVIEFSASEYDRVNETTIQVKNNVFNSGFEALYDVTKGQFISERFTAIKSFEQVNEDSKEKLAKAILRIPYNNAAKNVCDVVCYIDESGNIRTPLYNPHSDSYIDTTTEDFDFTKSIDTIKTQIDEETAKKSAAANSLVKTISPQKISK